MTHSTEGEELAFSWMNISLALVLFMSPWFFGYDHDGRASWCAWASSLAIIGLAGLALVRSPEWGECANLVVALWLIAAPWLLEFTNVPIARWTHFVIGVLVAAFSGWTLKALRSATT